MEPSTSLKEILAGALNLKGLTLLRLHQATSVPDRYLEFLFAEEYTKMPAAPYARGYLMKISEALDLDKEEVWELYKKEANIKSSGKEDVLPGNRFALVTLKKRWIVSALLLAGLLAYGAANAGRIIGKPDLTLFLPYENSVVTSEATALLAGKTSAGSKLAINGEEIALGKNGEFSKNYSLDEGINTFAITATKLLGKESTVVKQIIYQPTTP